MGAVNISGISTDIILEGFTIIHSATWGVALSIYSSDPASAVYVNKCRIVASDNCYETGCHGAYCDTKLYMTYCDLFRGYAHTVYADRIGYLSLHKVLINNDFYAHSGDCDVVDVSTYSTGGYGIAYGDYLITI